MRRVFNLQIKTVGWFIFVKHELISHHLCSFSFLSNNVKWLHCK